MPRLHQLLAPLAAAALLSVLLNAPQWIVALFCAALLTFLLIPKSPKIPPTPPKTRRAPPIDALIADALHDAVVTLNQNGEVLFANSAAQLLAHSSLKSMKNQHLSLFFRHPEVLHAIDAVAENPQKPLHGQILVPPPNQQTLQYLAQSLPTPKRPHKNTPQTLLILRDLSHEHRVFSLRDDFLANASHQFRTPLTVAKAAAETIQSLHNNHNKSKHALNALNRSLSRMENLAANILALNHAQMLETTPSQRRSIPADALADARDAVLAHPTPDNPPFQVNLNAPDNLPHVLIPHDDLVQISEIILHNARIHSQSPKPVVITAQELNNSVSFSFRDHGNGVPKHDLARLTERFFRSNDALNKPGAGLGLAIAKHLLARSQASLSFQDARPGLLVSFSLPVAPKKIQKKLPRETIAKQLTHKMPLAIIHTHISTYDYHSSHTLLHTPPHRAVGDGARLLLLP